MSWVIFGAGFIAGAVFVVAIVPAYIYFCPASWIKHVPMTD